MSVIPPTLVGILAIVAFVLVVIPFIVASFLRNVEAGTIRLVSHPDRWGGVFPLSPDRDAAADRAGHRRGARRSQARHDRDR